MQLTTSPSYPSTHKFEQFLLKQELLIGVADVANRMEVTPHWRHELPPTGNEKKENASRIAIILHQMLGDYEHGTVDWDVVLRLCNDPIMAVFNKLYFAASIDDSEIDKMVYTSQQRALETLRGIYEDIILTMVYS